MSVGQESSQRPPGRGNGLAAQVWIAIADVDPRVADDVLITLHANAIAAYIEPTPADGGLALEQRLPMRMTDRVFADANAVGPARRLVAAELADIDASDAETALLPAGADEGHVTDDLDADPADEHFVPPPAPPLPRLRPSTVAGLAAIALGIVILVTGWDGGSLSLLGVLAIAVGVGILVWHMKDGPPTDSGWDDGAVL